MGVPAFFRWLSKKYASIIVDAVEEKNKDVNGVNVPVDATKQNPNFQEFDNLYLDMNGIIHPCTHPEDRPAPKTEDEMFILIFEYIDRLFSIVRPRRVLYMAIDGVAPRAKMNQQRSRRFRAAKEAYEKKEQILSVRKKLESEGVPLPPPKKEEEHFDSNCITPGTPFMDRLAVALRYYVHKKISTDPAWQSIQVILSDANVPGEGEHKIMDYIRRQRASPKHDPNTVHCLCGADADLIMLGLATHEANFNILREEFVPNQPRACELCGQYGHELENCKGLAHEEAGPDQADPLKKEKNFIFIRLPVLREYLEKELAMPNLPFEYDFERAIDDWVFMCFFVGNDFLPHLPSLEIRENAIDRLIKLYKNVVYTTKGWLTKSGDVYMDRVQTILIELGKVEDEIFKTRQIREVRYRQQNKNRNAQGRDAGGGFSFQRRQIPSLRDAASNNFSNTPPAPRPYDKDRNKNSGGSQPLSSNRFSPLAVPFIPGQPQHPIPLSALNPSVSPFMPITGGAEASGGYGAPPSLLQKVTHLRQTISQPPVPPEEVIMADVKDEHIEGTTPKIENADEANDEEKPIDKDKNFTETKEQDMSVEEARSDEVLDQEVKIATSSTSITDTSTLTTTESSTTTATSKESSTTTGSKSKSKSIRNVPKGGPAFVPENASLIAPVSSVPAYMSGAETRKRAAEDRLEMQRCAEASERLKAILLPAGSKRPASSAQTPDQCEPRPKSFKEASGSRNSSVAGTTPGTANKSTNGKDDDEDDEPPDEIRLWESGWKERYYQAKFGVSESDAEFRRKVAWAYAEGLCWVLKYYYQGCVSWNWYFPYHYAPFASDFDTIGKYKPDFSKPTQPFKPLEQLMGVFPAASRFHIPESWRSLMTDESSPIYDFYPKDFDIDLNGKKYAWQGVALLPFVDETRLLAALDDVYPELTDDERRRNDKGPDRLFVGQQHPLFSSLLEVFDSGKAVNFEVKKDENGHTVREWVYIDTNKTNGMAGEVSWDKDAVAPNVCYPTLFPQSYEFNDVKTNTCIMVVYRDPQFPPKHVFEAVRLSGIKELERVLKPGDWDERRNGQFRPQIGFTRDVPRANLSSVGHRILNHAVHHNAGGSPQLQPLLQPLSGSTWRHSAEGYRGGGGGYRPHLQGNGQLGSPLYQPYPLSGLQQGHQPAPYSHQPIAYPMHQPQPYQPQPYQHQRNYGGNGVGGAHVGNYYHNSPQPYGNSPQQHGSGHQNNRQHQPPPHRNQPSHQQQQHQSNHSQRPKTSWSMTRKSN